MFARMIPCSKPPYSVNFIFMINQVEAIGIAKELKDFKEEKQVRWWRTDMRTKQMMDWYNTNIQFLQSKFKTVLKPMSMNCNPCIGKVVNVLILSDA